MCGVCGTRFAYKEILRSHISTIHKKKCLKCGKVVSNLKSHTKKKHSSETNFEKDITEIQNLVNENIKGEAKKVPKRGKVKIKKILNRHISTFHNGQLISECPLDVLNFPKIQRKNKSYVCPRV